MACTPCEHVDADDTSLCDNCGVEFEDGNDTEDNEEEHECSFDLQVVKPRYLYADASCESAELYKYSCLCKKAGKEVFAVGEPLGHDISHYEGQAPTNLDPGWEAYDECARCGYTTYVEIPPLGGFDELPGDHWDRTSLIFQMTDNSKKGELSSGCKRYLSGESGEIGGIYASVKSRNDDAEEYANVDVEYLYFPDTSGYDWGQTITEMEELATSATEKGRPDMFCNFVYDMVSASLLGSFANLYSDQMHSVGVKETERNNYFAFAKNGRYDATYVDTDDGYMIEYMQSLTLSEHKMYLLASDYFIDIVRALFVVPVNIELLEKIEPSSDPTAYNYDADGDAKYEISDFYALVYNHGWSYDAVKAFSNDIESGTGGADILDGIHGFAVAVDEIGASGLLYTTSVQIINRKVETFIDPDTGLLYQDYTFWYPEGAEALEAFCENLTALFSSEGVTAVRGSIYGESDALAVRNRFAQNKVLFGGISLVGHLEDSDYKAMAGYGIAPVPLYRANYIDPETNALKVDNYLAQVHNVGRVGAIAVKTGKYAQCSAFLDYQSLNSADILDEYFDLILESDTGNTVEGNIEMLGYLRENIRSSFDKAFEDAIGRFYLASGDKTYNSEKWHNMILTADFKLSRMDMFINYSQVMQKKAAALVALEISYSALP